MKLILVELKSGGNKANNLPTQTDPAGLTNLPQYGSKIRGKSPCKRLRDADDADSHNDFESRNENDMFLLSEVDSTFMPLWKQCSKIPL